MKKIYIAAVGVLFSLLLIGSPLLFFANKAGIYEVKNLGNVTETAEHYEGTPADGLLNVLVDMKNTLTALYTDCLPGYYETVMTYNKTEDTLNKPFMTLYSNARQKAAEKQKSESAVQPTSDEQPTPEAVDTLEIPNASDVQDTTTVNDAQNEQTVPETQPDTVQTEQPQAEQTQTETEVVNETSPVSEDVQAEAVESGAEPEPVAEAEPVAEPEPAVVEETVPDEQKLVSVSSEFIGADNVHRHYRIKATFGDGYESEFLDTAVILTDHQKDARVRSQAEKLNKIADSNTDVNFYFMLFTRMQDTDYYEDVIVGEDSTKKYADQFFSLLSDNITAQRWKLDSVRDRVERVYLTDHHWNTYGSYLGFLQICEMICPDVTPIELGEPIDFPLSRFYGSFARTCMTLDLWDVFRVYDYDFGPFKISPFWKFSQQVAKLDGKEYVTPDRNIYAIFFPEEYEVHFTENNTGRNLLVLGDSYTQGFIELLASAFDNTYAFYYGNYSGLKYNTFIKEHNITDVLFEQFSDRILFDLYGDDKLAEIRVD